MTQFPPVKKRQNVSLPVWLLEGVTETLLCSTGRGCLPATVLALRWWARRGKSVFSPEVKASGIQIAAFRDLDLRRVLYMVNTKAGLGVVVCTCHTGAPGG